MSLSFSPLGSNNFIPLSSYELWDAEIITPTSHLIDLVSIDIAGVGIGPTRKTFIPIEIKPAVREGSIKYPESLVSLPITTLCLCLPLVKYSPAAIPTFKAVSPVIG